jgi:hypothetical protein
MSLSLGLPFLKIIDNPLKETQPDRKDATKEMKILNMPISGTIDLFTSMNKDEITNLKKNRKFNESDSLLVKKLKISKGADIEQ